MESAGVKANERSVEDKRAVEESEQSDNTVDPKSGLKNMIPG